nr:MAG TPA: hypothetical protein [Caudoviricetes sp.]
MLASLIVLLVGGCCLAVVPVWMCLVCRGVCLRISRWVLASGTLLVLVLVGAGLSLLVVTGPCPMWSVSPLMGPVHPLPRLLVSLRRVCTRLRRARLWMGL